MKLTKLVLSLVLATFSNYALAAGPAMGHGMGNGGDAVVCYTDASRNTIKSVQMFDYWEQQQVLPYGAIDLGAANLSVQDKITIATNRVAKFDPELAEKIKFQALNLANNIQNYLVTAYQLPEIDDATPQVVPTQPNCFIEQFGVQYKDLITGQRRFSIADKFYNFAGISNDERAGLLLHEALYRLAILKNSLLENSDNVRYFNYIIASDILNQTSLLNADKYDFFLSQSNFNIQECKKVSGFYVYDYNRNPRSCYNQSSNINANLNVEVAQHSKIEYNDHFKTIQFSNNFDYNLATRIIFNSGSKTYSIKTNSAFTHYADSKSIDFNDAQAITAAGLPTYLGPLNMKFNCTGGTYSFDTQSMTNCRTKDEFQHNGISYKFSYLERATATTWKIHNQNQNSVFNVLGSTKNLKLGLNASVVTIDNQLNLIEANYYPSSFYGKSDKISINGVNYLIGNHLRVSMLNGQYVLETVTKESEIVNPKINNLRLVSTATILGVADNYCKTIGLKTGRARYEREYINYESFYDINTNKNVFKSDEYGDVIKMITCHPTEITTTNY